MVEDDSDVAATSLIADLDTIDTWASSWVVDLNCNKTCYIPPVHCGFYGNIINESTKHCHLGLVFHIDAKWTSHINKIHKKACKRLNL